MFIAFVVASFACADPVPKAAPEPAWMANFRKAYELKEGQYVKRIAPPYIPERIHFLMDVQSPPKDSEAYQEWREHESKRREHYLKEGKWYTLIFDQSGTNLRMRTSLSSLGLSLNLNLQRGDNLHEVSTAIFFITGIRNPEFIIDPRFAQDPLFNYQNLTVHGDFVVRYNAPVEKLAVQLEAILRNECKIPCKLRVDMVEQEVYVAQGMFKLSPPEWRKASENPRLKKVIDIYATKDALDPNADHFGRNQKRNNPQKRILSNESSGTLVELLRFLGYRLEKRIVWDRDLPSEPIINWCNHFIYNPSFQERARDIDPALVLKNMESQIGLTFKKETRKVPMMVIYPSELK
ncbi:MAG: hypothetical protein U0798_15390 [Gemmataceae bacterium]